MQKDMFRKVLVCGILVLLVGIGIVPMAGSLSIERVSKDNKMQNSDFGDDDTTPPVTTHSLDPGNPDGENGWYVSDVTVTLNATDDKSGVKEIRYRVNGEPGSITGDHGIFKIEDDGKNIEVEYWAIDNVGNKEDINKFTIDMDQTPPEVPDEISWDAFRDGPFGKWYIIFKVEACGDATSGLDRAEFHINNGVADIDYKEPYKWIFVWSDIFYYVTVKIVVFDQAGNSDFLELWRASVPYCFDSGTTGNPSQSQPSSISKSSYTPSGQNVMDVIPSTESVDIENQICKTNLGDDTTPPVTTPHLDPPMPDGDNGWYVSDVTVTLNATDDMSGVFATYYRVNNGTWGTYTAPIVMQSDGHCLVEYYSVDYAGNEEKVKSFVIKVDQTLPEIEKFVYDDYKDGLFGDQYFAFKAKGCNDTTSGLDRVEFHVNDGRVYDPRYGEPYVWTFLWSDIFYYVTLKVVAFDQAGNSAYSTDLEPESYPYCFDSEVIGNPLQSQPSSQQSSNPLFTEKLR